MRIKMKSPNFKLIRLTADEFEAVADHLKRTARRQPLDSTIQMARAVLVDGMTTTQACEQFKVARQRLSTVVMDFQAAYKTFPHRDEMGLLTADLVFPARLANDVANLIDILEQSPDKLTEIRPVRGRKSDD